MIKKEDFKAHAHKTVEWIDHYLQHIKDHPVKSPVKPKSVYAQIPAEAPAGSESFDQIMEDLDKIIMPGITHWQHPNFHAYFPANSSVEALTGEFITAAIGAQCMIWETSPAAAELEERMMEWLRDLTGLPENFEGVIQDSASSATLTAILTARERQTGFRSNEEGVPNNLRVYCSSQAHSSVEKAVGIAGMGRKNLVKIGVDEQMAMSPTLLSEAIETDIREGKIPCCVVAAIGTTGTLAVDPLAGIASICKKHNIWLHVDAAYAGSALILPEYRYLAKGIEGVDSFVFNPHKWLFTNFDCSAYFVKDVDLLIKTFEILPEYLITKTRGMVNDYRDWGIPLGRRFRALKLWFVLRSFGVTGLQQQLRKHIGLNNWFASELIKNPHFKLIGKPFLNFTGFRFEPADITDPEEIDTVNAELLDRINTAGNIFLTHTKVNGRYMLRMIIGQTYVEKEDVERALREILDAAGM